jgi:hypothetical protein
MTERYLPRYPVYVPSRGRFDKPKALTVRFLIEDEVPFHLVIEKEEYDQYKQWGEDHILVLPESNQGLIFSRNWIKAHATEAGFERHWQLDDNIRQVYRRFKRTRIRCNSGTALRVVEDFVDRYENVAIAGLNYDMFAPDEADLRPFTLNAHVYSCSLILNALPYRWRLPLNDDTDLCLQVLAGGWCTVLVNAFLVKKQWTMTLKGGNTGIYTSQDGRLKMAKSLERVWPGVVQTKRRFHRPQHYIDWTKFDTPLKLKPGRTLDPNAKPNEYGLELVQVKEIKSPDVQRFYDENKPAE